MLKRAMGYNFMCRCGALCKSSFILLSLKLIIVAVPQSGTKEERLEEKEKEMKDKSKNMDEKKKKENLRTDKLPPTESTKT